MACRSGGERHSKEQDSKVRKVDVRVGRQDTQRVYSRPVSEVILLVKRE